MDAPRKIRVAVLFGGRSAEHEISLLSARNVLEALDPEKFEPVLVGIDKGGRWLLQEQAVLLQGSRDPRLARLNQAMPDVSLAPHPDPRGETALAVAGQSAMGVDVVLPVLHGPMGEDGSIQGLLELAGVPYVGAGVLGSAVGMDKDVMKRLLIQAEIPTVPYVSRRRIDWERDRTGVVTAAEALGYPLFVKPANLGSSVGVGRATNRTELEAAVVHALEFDTKLIIEQGVPNAREIECSILGNDDPIASVPGEIVVDHPDGFYSYAAKYIDEHGTTTRIPADIGPDEASAVQRLALHVFRVLECSGLARIDFFLSSNGQLFVNEINTLPGFTAISMYPKLWEASGVPPRALVTRLIELALERAAQRRTLRTST